MNEIEKLNKDYGVEELLTGYYGTGSDEDIKGHILGQMPFIYSQGDGTYFKMRNCICIIIGLLLMSCNPFHQDTVMEPDVQEIIDFMHDYGNVIFDSDSDDRFAEDMKRLDIDLIIKNLDKKNRQFAGFVEESDSLLIFVKKSHSIFRPEKRIIYDFAKAPRNFGNDTITGASYEIKQLNDRWYFSTVGFD